MSKKKDEAEQRLEQAEGRVKALTDEVAEQHSRAEKVGSFFGCRIKEGRVFVRYNSNEIAQSGRKGKLSIGYSNSAFCNVPTHESVQTALALSTKRLSWSCF